jgi:hypothetical protein
MKHIFLSFLFGFCIYNSMEAQQINLRNTEWMNYLEEMAEQDEIDQASVELLYEELSYLSENPLNINTLNKSQLERFPFLSEKQIEELLYYIYKYGPLPELLEIKNVENLDWQTLNYLLPFLYAGEVEKKEHFQWKNLFRYAKQEMLVRSDYTFQEKAGYRKSEEEKQEKPSDYYLGEPYYLSFRYGYRFQNKIQFGIAGEKDAGETLWKKDAKNFDHYAFNFNLKEVGILKDLHIGDYRLSYGEGLTINTQFSMGKTSDVVNIGQRNPGIKRHASPNENNYFRGISARFQIKSIDFDFFVSSRYHDANSDSASIYTFKTDGYNRTGKDLEKRRTALVKTLGGNIQWRNENMTVGIVSTFYSFGGKKTDPEPQLYNLYYLRARNHGNLGIHYLYQENHFILKGETAIDLNGKSASLNHLIIQPNNRINVSLSVRNYRKDYNAFFGKAFGEASSVQNESGAYAGIRLRPNGQWEIHSYLDLFHFPWLRYGINSPSSGKDFLLGIIYRKNSNFQFNFRYKYKEKSKNQIQEDARNTFILPYRQHRFLQQINYTFSEQFSLKTRVDYTIYEEKNIRTGWAISTNFSFTPDKDQIQWDAGMVYFHTDDWNTRISAYEKNVLYAFSFPTYYGKGFRCYSAVKWKIQKALTLYFKLSNTHYFDRVLIGSGLEEIEGHNKSDVSALIKVSF